MKIGFFTDVYWPKIDGVVVSIDLMRKALEELGHDVYVICPTYPDQGIDDQKIIRVRGFDPLKFSNFTSRISLADLNDRRKIEALNLDIVHSHTQYTAGLLAQRIAERQGVPHVSTYHTHVNELIQHFPYSFHISSFFALGIFTIYSRRFGALKAGMKHPGLSQQAISNRIDELKKVYFRDIDMIISNAPHVDEHLRSLNLRPPIKMIKNGIDTSQYRDIVHSFSLKPLRISYIARLSAEKRQDTIIEAVAELVRDGYDVELHLAGEGPHEEYCRQLVAELRLEKVVTFHGALSQQEVKQLLANTDLGVFASYKFDTYPLTMLEYLAAGVPTVYCDPHFDDMASKMSVIRTSPDSHGFAETIKSIFDAKTLTRMSHAAQKEASNHDIRARAAELAKLYKNLVKQPARSAKNHQKSQSRTRATARD